jgi:hypothetical protein
MHKDAEINYQHIVAVSATAIFPGFRSLVGWTGLFGLVVAVALILIGSLPSPAMLDPPTCNRVALTSIGSSDWPRWGRYIQLNGHTYVTADSGSGICELVRLGQQLKDGAWYQTWKEVSVPPGMGEQITAQLPPKKPPWQIGFFLGMCSAALLVGLWLPATILAAAGNNLMSERTKTNREIL